MSAAPPARDVGSDARGFVSLPDGGRIAFEVSGDAHAGPPVLLVRPLAGAMAMWGTFRDALAEEFRVIAYDLRGVGASSDAPLDVSTRAMAADALAVLDELHVARAHVFGISLGAMVATWLAVDAPSRVERLCLASAGPVGFTLSVSGLVQGAGLAVSLLAPGDDVVRRLTGALIPDEVRAEEPERVASLDAAASEEPARRVELVKHVLAAGRHDARDALSGITAPTLVLVGARDTLVGVEPARSLCEAISGARLEVLDDVGHALTLEQPQETAARVVAFFSIGRSVPGLGPPSCARRRRGAGGGEVRGVRTPGVHGARPRTTRR